MRFIGTISDPDVAAHFGDYLTSIGVANNVEQGASGFAVWVHDDDLIERGRTELTAFNADPGAVKYAAARGRARRLQKEQEKRRDSLRRNYIDLRTNWAGLRNRPMPITLVLILICSVVAIATKCGTVEESRAQEWLQFGRLSDQQLLQRQWQQQVSERTRRWIGRSAPRHAPKFQLIQPGMEDIARGQVWRLWTPMFLHYGIMHFAFNMIWLFDLGNMIERARGTLVFLGLVLLSSLIGSLAQFYLAGPYFGGMSGVVYGLFGYVWVKSIVQPQLGLRVGKNTIAIMMIWLVACMVGIIPNIANGGHVGGLLAGMILAHGPYSWQKIRRAWAARRAG